MTYYLPNITINLVQPYSSWRASSMSKIVAKTKPTIRAYLRLHYDILCFEANESLGFVYYIPHQGNYTEHRDKLMGWLKQPSLAETVDHKIVHGADGLQFLVARKGTFEDFVEPKSLIAAKDWFEQHTKAKLFDGVSSEFLEGLGDRSVLFLLAGAQQKQGLTPEERKFLLHLLKGRPLAYDLLLGKEIA